MRRFAFPAFAFLFAASAAQDQWIHLVTPHFEMYTTGSERRAREVILYFEEVRGFFVQASPVHGVTEFPVRIVGFKNLKQYEPYRINAFATAFFTKGRYRDYIVLGDLEAEHLPVAIHEYMHLVVQNSGIKLPVWLDEGWADVYSTLKPLGQKSMVGDLIPGRVQVLQREKWMSFEELTSVGHKSAAYNEKNRASIFYAESWALTHMLYLSPAYGNNFNKFLLALNSGATANDACRSAFGKSGAEVFADLQNYLRGNQLFGAIFNVKLSKSEEEASVDRPAAFDAALMSADLFAATNRLDRAKSEYEALAARNPDRPEVPQSLGYLAWQKHDAELARMEFEKAFAAGSKDPQMCFHLAMFELQHGDVETKAIPALRRALEVKPDYFDARLELGIAELRANQYTESIADLKLLKTIKSDIAGRYLNALAYSYAHSGNLSEARKQAESAKKWDRSDPDKEQTASLLRYLDAQERTKPEGVPDIGRTRLAPAAPRENILRVEGVAKEVRCEGGLQFTIVSGGKVLTFAMPKPQMILIKHKSDVIFDFKCGPQKEFPITVEYVPAERRGEIAGYVKMLEF